MSKTEVEYYRCASCRYKQDVVTTRCPVLLTESVRLPVRCSCGSNDFNAFIKQTISILEPVKYIITKIEVK